MSETDKQVIAAIIPAAGSGSRMRTDVPKQFLELGGVPILVRTIGRFLQVSEIRHIVVALPADHRLIAEQILRRCFSPDQYRRLMLVTGGESRQESVLAGLDALPPGTGFVLVHDGARPFVGPELIRRCLRAAVDHGAAIVAVPVRDTIKQVSSSGEIAGTVDRSRLWQAQTPQAAATGLLRRAYEEAQRAGFEGTDEASLLEHAGIPVRVIEGSEENIKITRPDDLKLAANINKESNMLRIGHGFDAHRYKIGRHLILGGVDIPFDLGLEGHSDADVIIHAFIDALFGAMGIGDIGRHFPDNDPQYKDISSLKLLEKTIRLVEEKKFTIGNADITVICQRPRLAPFVDEMRTNLAAACSADPDSINIKATTTEMMGYTGRGEGIAVHAVVLLQSRSGREKE
ncbi:MAG: 2-C-methyl-D-erythritol 4-phosphate cytidylyltransferase [Desulfobulbaceae bacterium]|nr:2-C-methyl-D-erythritol 4-phosphate cytidylyltransferase [Desulfobulbaceae bacterium]